jgi:hypothetical protein
VEAATVKTAAVEATAVEAATAVAAPATAAAAPLGVGGRRSDRQRRSGEQCGRERYRSSRPFRNVLEPHIRSPI